jgi:hypothetical protein
VSCTLLLLLLLLLQCNIAKMNPTGHCLPDMTRLHCIPASLQCKLPLLCLTAQGAKCCSVQVG